MGGAHKMAATTLKFQALQSLLMRHELPRLAPTGAYQLCHPHRLKYIGRPVCRLSIAHAVHRRTALSPSRIRPYS